MNWILTGYFKKMKHGLFVVTYGRNDNQSVYRTLFNQMYPNILSDNLYGIAYTDFKNVVL